tara:strand:+ start:711 stop:1655 length:945 start_codon:yes stop_codon:yes gene_type:complete
MPRTRPLQWPLLVGALFLFTACDQQSDPRASSPVPDSVDLRITEAPWEPQAQMTRRMDHLTTFLKDATGLTIGYVPAINYAHSYALVERGEADLILVGIYGGYRLLKALPHAVPLVVQKPSYRLVMLGHRRWMEGLDPADKPSLASVKGRRVGFGSRFSGSAFLQPLLAMQEIGLNSADIDQCWHEPVQRHLPAQVANGLVDFVFVPSYSDKEEQFIPEPLRDELAIAWMGNLGRNDYLIAAVNPMDTERQEHLLKVQQAFLELDRTTDDGRAVLDSYMLPGFELPTSQFPEVTNQRIEALLSSSAGLPSCEAF